MQRNSVLAVTLFKKSRFLGENMLPANVTIFVLNLTRNESPNFVTMDKSQGSTIRKISVVAVLLRYARFFWAWENSPSTKSLLPSQVRGANIAFCSGRSSLWEFKL